MNDYYDMIRLYRKFTAGTKYLNRQLARGIDITRDKERFLREVVDPMDETYSNLKEEDKAQITKTTERV